MNGRTIEPLAKRPLIALLEDDDGVRRSMQLLLQGRGFNVKAFSGAEALLEDPDMGNAAYLIADYWLGELDGISVLGTLRKRGWTGQAMLITAFGTAELGRRATTAGFCEVFEKPVRDHALVAALDRLTGLRQRDLE